MNESDKSTQAGRAAQHAEELVSLKAGRLRWQLRASICPDSIADLLRNPDQFLANPALHLKHSRVVTVARVPAGAPHLPGLVLRRLNYGKFRHRLRDVFRPSRARRALMHGLMLEGAGIATARPWAAAERRLWRWPLAAYLITEEIQGATTLAKVVAKNRWPPRTVVHGLAGLIAQLHNQGFSHRDLKATNILFDSALAPFLIDLDGIRRLGTIGQTRMAADLAILAYGTVHRRHLSAVSGWRFLKRYCELRNMNASVRALAVEIADVMAKQTAAKH